MAAELRLGVSFDLVYFRQQLQKLSRIASSEFTAPIKIKLDRRVINQELNNLQRAIKRRKYNIELNIAGNLTKKSFDDLQQRLDALSNRKKVEVPVSVKNAATGKEVADAISGLRARIAQNQPIKQGGGKLRVGLSVRPAITNVDVAYFKKAVQAKFSGISVKIKADIQGGFASGSTGAAGLYEYMRTQGLSGGNMPQPTEVGRSERLKKALEDLTVTQLRKIASGEGLSGYSKLRKDPLIDKLMAELSQETAEGLLGNIKNQMMRGGGSPIKRSFLDQIARAVFWMAGVDPEQLRREAARRRQLPGIDWPASVPSRQVPIGPSSTGRLLPAGATPNALPGTAFGGRGFLPTDIGQDLQRILRAAAYAFVDAMSARIRSVNVMDVGRRALPPSQIRGLLPAAIGRAPSIYGTTSGIPRSERIERAYARSAARAAAVLSGESGGTFLGAGGSGSAGPYRPFAQPPRGGAIVPYTGGIAAGVQAGGGGLGRLFGGMPNLPGSGSIREIGEEFGFAAKQVLLFGTAYKALAFATSFPQEVLSAVGALQSYRNTLETITPSAQEFEESNELILSLVKKYNVPLESARNGFTKLYASMEPAGFGGNEIRELFTGISKAAATFGMSADQVDRVNYAFAQMASKGQVMSEELKGQLGDVLPGAMAIFAEAAGFEGENAIKDFSKALEDGAYKGKAMKDLLTNVSVILNKEFGPGAEGAARTIQGSINRIQNSMKLLYETFEPVALGFMNAVVTPMTAGIKTLADGFSAFFNKTKAETAGGFAIAQELERLKPAFDGLMQNVQNLVPVFSQFASIALEVGKIFLQIAGSPFAGYLARVYAIILPLNIAVGITRGLLASTAVQFLVFNARILTGTSTLSAFRGMMAATGQTAAATSAVIRGAFATTGIGLVLVGLGLLIERFSTLGAKMDEVKRKAAGAADAIRMMSAVEARVKEQQISAGLTDITNLEGYGGTPLALRGKKYVPVSQNVAKRLEDLGVPMTRDIMGKTMIDPEMLPAYREQLLQQQSEAEYRQKQLRFEEQQQKTPAALATITPEGGDKTGKGAGEKLKEYIANAKNLLSLEKERELNAVRLKELNKEVSETEARNQEALINQTYETLAVKEALRVAEIEVANEKMSAADKELKLNDLKKESIIELGNINQKYAIETTQALIDLQKPFQDGILGTDKAIAEQRLQMDALRQGFNELSPDVKAYLDVQDKLAGKSVEEINRIKKEIDAYRQIRTEYYKNIETLKQLELLKGVEDRLAIGRSAYGQERRQELINEGFSSEFAEGISNLEQYAQKLERIRGGFNDLEDSIRSSLGGAITDVLTDFSSMEDSVMKLRQSVADAFKSMANMIIQEMLRAAVHWAVAKIFSFLGSNLAGPAPASPVVMAANGGVLAGGFQAFASGGVVTGPTLGLVGEGRFNEAVVPLPNGKSIPVDLGGAAGSNISTNIVVNVNNGQASSQVNGAGGQSLGRELEGAVRSVILKESRPGGIIYNQR